jgi:hypothetical protein
MSNIRYIEVDSTYRNRNLWPKAGEFQVEISQTGTKDRYTAFDPVSLAAPLYCWTSNNFDKLNPGEKTATFTIEPPSSSLPITYSETPSSIIVSAPIGSLQQSNDYYQSAVVKVGTELSRIYFSKYLGTDLVLSKDYMQLTLDREVDINAGSIEISDPTDLTLNPAVIFIPSGRRGENAYVNCLIYNETRNEYRKNLGYSYDTHLLTINTTTTNFSGGPITNWKSTDTYCLRKEPPLLTNGVSIPVSNSNMICVDFYSNIYSGMTGFYDKLFIRFTSGPAKNQVQQISRYCVDCNTQTKKFILCNPFNTKTGNFNSTYLDMGYTDADTVELTSTQLIISGADLPLNQIIVNDVVSIQDQVFIIDRIIDMSETDQVFNIKPYPPSTEIIPIGTTTFDDANLTNLSATFEILPFSYDNAVPFSYSGSLVSQQEEVCYEIELLNLVLPNTNLSTGQGSRIAFYPYVYVEFTNVSGASAGVKNIIYSNNPNSNKSLFRCPVTDVSNPIVTNFINLSSDGMVQTIKFKPNDNLKFAVKLSNGEVYSTTCPERYSPFPPVLEEQISAVFSIKRVS